MTERVYKIREGVRCIDLLRDPIAKEEVRIAEERFRKEKERIEKEKVENE